MPERRLAVLKGVLWTLVGVLAAVTAVRFAHGLGAVTNLSDAAPWGLWVGFDVMGGVALAAGGFVLAAAVHVFGIERYRPFVRPAILTALLGYAAVAVGLLYDLGLPWRIWHPAFHPQVRSVLFEVAMCVMLYLTVLCLEFAPAVLEHPRFDRPLFRGVHAVLRRATLPLVVAGIVLSTLHQSSLGSLFLIAPHRLHPLWYSPVIYVQFFVSAVALGLMTVVLESLLSRWFLGHEPHGKEIAGLGAAAAAVLWVYAGIRVGDLALRGVLGTAFEGTWMGPLFAFEMLLSAVLPGTLLLFRRVRGSLAGMGLCAAMAVSGMVLHRLDTAFVAIARPEGAGYFPAWEEFAVSLGIVAGAALVFLFFVEHLKVYGDVGGAPIQAPPAGHHPSTLDALLPRPLAAPRRYSGAVLAGAAAALLLLPVAGAEPHAVPAREARRAEGTILEDAAGARRPLLGRAGEDGAPRLLLAIDGNRDGNHVLFDHDGHRERLGGPSSCAVCHHLDLPLDRGTPCASCHRDMYGPTPLFSHASHEAALGGAEGCTACHGDPAEAKTPGTATPCADCHRRPVADGSVVPPPEKRWRPAPGYMEAMHGLCLECHRRRAAAEPGAMHEEFGHCRQCHDTDRRDVLRALAPAPGRGGE